MTALAAELESLPPATLYLTLSKLSTKGLRLLLDESISVVSDRLKAGDNAASKLKDLLHVKADPVGTVPASGRDASAPAADASTLPEELMGELKGELKRTQNRYLENILQKRNKCPYCKSGCLDKKQLFPFPISITPYLFFFKFKIP